MLNNLRYLGTLEILLLMSSFFSMFLGILDNCFPESLFFKFNLIRKL